ncbi:MAG: TonB family protein [Burkholderiales bacterium]|nr:TonB family protein [Burkholderiales bacterium]
MVEVLRNPIEVSIVEEVRAPPAPAPKLPAPPRPAAPPPPLIVPPPEVTAVTEPPPATMAAATPLAVQARLEAGTCDKPDYPTAALRAEATGTSRIRFTVDASGMMTRAEVERSAGPTREHRMLDQAAIGALSKCRFKPGLDKQGQAAGGVAVVEYVWKID